MNIGISQIGLSTSILNNVTIDSEQDGDVFDLNVQISGRSIYSTQLYCNASGYAHLYDLGILVNEYMRDHSYNLAKLDVIASFDHHYDSASVYVVYSEMKFSYEVDLEFLQHHFLTTRTFYNIPRGSYLSACFVINNNDEQPIGFINACFRLNDGSVHTLRYQLSIYDYQQTKLYSYTINSSIIEAKLRESYPSDNPKVLSGSLTMGARNLDFYFLDEQPVDKFDFLNAFNCWECYYVYGTQTIKSEFNQKEALQSGVSKYYAQSSERKVEIETVPLTLEEADWLNQFLGSHYVSKQIPPDDDQQIIISDIDSEISDSASDKVQLKFSWKFSQPFKWKIYTSTTKKFNDKFNEAFG